MEYVRPASVSTCRACESVSPIFTLLVMIASK
ncbi:hypothetical protein ESB00_16410 [Oleiharenicola lentus]|uniref:Uncharacterized protein n=1 Tax=Oleiharenicola lentus TaxID=2508720 RepID=A0A4Q1C617_9BACT|nr:hypothetical protein ESB00_16410 [Oleiharenicola lentus]